jgi:cytochrome c-type biogenesis protein
MLESIRARGPLRTLTTMQLVVLAVVGLILIFLVIGTINQAIAPKPQFEFGLQPQPFIVLAVLAFLGGFLSFVSPCTLPILPAYFAFAVQSDRKHIALNTVVFMLGLGTMFSLLGATASVIGRTLNQNQQLILLIGGALVIVFGVMSLLGKGFTGLVPNQNEEQVQNTSLGGSYLFGLTFAVGWSSCVGPILGTVLTMAGTTGSVLRGVMLGFIYTLGLGLPLIVVSTFFGRASRKSLFWRILRGKGWQVSVSTLVVGLIWALAIWFILMSFADYLFFHVEALGRQELTTFHRVGMLVIAVLAVGLWIAAGPNKGRIDLHLHSTQLVSGVLFIMLGVMMLSGQLTAFNQLATTPLSECVIAVEDQIVTRLTGAEPIPFSEACPLLNQ